MASSRAIVISACVLGVLLLIVLILLLSGALGSSLSGKKINQPERVVIMKEYQNPQMNQVNIPYASASFTYQTPSEHRERRHGTRPRPRPKVPDNRLPMTAIAE